MMRFYYANGATPVNQDEICNLIPSGLLTQDDLNVFEQKNIKDAEDWLLTTRNKKLFVTDDVTDDLVRKIHKKMFDKTWKWADRYRKHNMNIGCDWQRIAQNVMHSL